MADKNALRRHQRSPVFVALLLFNLTLIVLQLWLFTATLENLLEGRAMVSFPAAVVSAVCAAINVWMLVGLYRMERRP